MSNSDVSTFIKQVLIIAMEYHHINRADIPATFINLLGTVLSTLLSSSYLIHTTTLGDRKSYPCLTNEGTEAEKKINSSLKVI